MWISELWIDLIESTITLVTTRNPDAPAKGFRLVFEQVGDISLDRYHAIDDPELAHFSPVHVKSLPNKSRARFRLDTGDARLVFEAHVKQKFTPLDGKHLGDTELFVVDS